MIRNLIILILFFISVQGKCQAQSITLNAPGSIYGTIVTGSLVGGLTSQVLVKASNADFDYIWGPAISGSYAGQTSITTLGTIGTGVWQGTAVADAYIASAATWNAKGTGTLTAVTGTANRITSSGGTTPAIDISASYVGQTSITTLGTIGTGTWQGTAVADAYIASAATWNAKGTGTLTAVSGTANRITSSGGTTPAIDISASYVGQTSITTLGTIGTGTWQGTAVADAYIASAATWNAKGTGTVTSVTGTANRITSSGGTTPAIDISASYVGQSSITTLGTIGTGVWQGTAIADANIASAATWNAKQSALTLSTGLTNTSGTVTVDLSTGKSGGQSVVGGTGSADFLTLSSTTNGTKGKINFGSNAAFDEVNTRLGINTVTPLSRLYMTRNANSVTQNDADGILIGNTTAATAGVQSISPPIVIQGNGWKTTATAASQDVRFRMDVLPVQGAANPTATFELASNINAGSYTNNLTVTSAGALTTTSLVLAGTITGATSYSGSTTAAIGSNLAVNTQGIFGTNTVTTLLYRTTNGGSDVTPKFTAGAPQTVTAGTLAYSIDGTNGLVFSAGNGTRQEARAGINITNLGNTAGSETGDMIFLTQTGGTAMAERVRIGATGLVGIGGTAVSTTDNFGSQGEAITSTATDLTLTVAHYTVRVDATGAPRTITLPAAAGVTRRIYTIIKSDVSANTVTIDGNASETINGALTKVISTQYAGCTIQCDGSNWFIIASF